MRSFFARIGLRAAVVAATILAGLAVASTASAAPEFGFSKFISATCEDPECAVPYTQAAGHPPVGLTVFRMNVLNPGATGKEVPVGFVKNIRIDVPAGLSTNPEAVPDCTMAEFGKEVATGIFEESACAPSTILGVNRVTVVVEPKAGEFADLQLEGLVYNIERPHGVPAEFGVALELGPLGHPGLYAHTLLEGGVSWHPESGLDKELVPFSGDYHELFKINDISNMPPLLESVIVYKGQAGEGSKRFLTLPSSCSAAQVSNVEAESYEGSFAAAKFPPAGEVKATGCDQVPFKPAIAVHGNTQPDLPVGATISVTMPPGTETIASSTLRESKITLPEGMTFNPSAANGLEACTDAQFGKGTTNKVKCPAGSKIGTVTIQTPNLPENALTGDVYVGQPVSGRSPSSGEEYRIFIDAESPTYGVAVRLEGRIEVDESTGRLTTIVPENPQIPFSEFKLELSNGNHTPLANPLICGPSTIATFFPYTGLSPEVDTDPFGVSCGTPSFSLQQSTSSLPTTAGSTTSFTLNLTRPDGEQYLSQVSTTLPAGLVAKIPSVPRCAERQAKEGKCPLASQVGTVLLSVGSGPSPFPLAGRVYLTRPVNGAPYGLSMVVPATKVGPYDYGNIVTIATIDIDPYTARVTIASTLPTIVGGVPLRLKSLTVAITHANYLLNPTSCGTLSTNTTTTSTMKATDAAATPFQATGCGALSFKPQFSAFSDANTTKRFGASLRVLVSESAGDANIRSISVTLPQRLASRLATLKLACAEKTFAISPQSCPKGSRVGGVTVTTPVLPGRLAGRAFFVSHGGAAFPDLDLVVKGDGVTMILVGKTNISRNITHSTFATLPDVPIESFELRLPMGRNSALAATGGLCAKKLFMPTTIVAQNGKTITQKTRIHVAECPVKVVGHRVHGHSATITAAVSAAGRLSTSGRDLRVVHKRIRKAVGNAKIAVRLSPLGKRLLAAHHRLVVRVRVGFKPSTGAKRGSKAFVKLTFRS